ncbi:serine/threonine-protein kinase [Nakamurella sp. UYEF19]|uniref:PASTA domain-containing protein n=1 Tax=Nakamurella sp. UYEF19 TaxID=1756392 RepID=UPI003397BD6A
MGTSGGATAGSSLIGAVLDGRYRVGAIIARGGMSTVYRGSDLRLDRPVAIKVMKPAFASDPSFLTRFEREARLAAGVAHRGVVGVYDQGRDGDVVFLVMELVDGGTLRDLMHQSGALSVSVTMSIMEPLLAALGAAHSAGLVHRDVKPENVLISSKGEVKVADFGLVRAVSSQTMATGDVILGTVAYLSPEQVATGASDPRSDVYAAGIVAFEMLTGHTPYRGDNAISVAYQHVHSDVPPVTDEAPGVPLELDDLVLAATRRDPMARPRDASAFLSSLVSLRARLGLARVAVPVPRSRPPVRPSSAGPTGTRIVPGGGPGSGYAGGPPARSGTVAARPGTAVVGGVGNTVRGAGGTGGGPVRHSTTASPTLDHAVQRPAAPVTPNGSPVRRRSALRRWLIVTIIVLLLGAAAAVGGWWLGSGRWAYSPPAVGVDQQSAENLVRDAGLVPRVSAEPSDTVAQGTVADTRPTPGSRLLRGSDVELLVSTGRPSVPLITPGSSAADASGVVTAADLTPTFDVLADRYDPVVPAGAVLATDPTADTSLPIGGVVVLVRSKGPAPESVPEVSGKNPDDARNRLLVAGFTVGADEIRFDALSEDGAVIGTDPAQGQLVARGSSVSLVISSSITVPTVRGESRSQAAADLTSAGFTVSFGDAVFDADIGPGDVVGTTPAAESRVDPAAATVVLTLSNAVIVPDVTKGDVGQARTQLSDLGLQLSLAAMFGGAGASVIGQIPDGGTRVEPGSTVQVSAFP